MSSYSRVDDEDYLEHCVEHYSQQYNWDCGVSCVLMLLEPATRLRFLDDFDLICEREGFGQITWTIDLSYLLKRYKIPHSMHTTMLGVNEAHRKHAYYQNIIDQDRERVSRRFDEAPSAGLHIVHEHLGMEHIMAHLKKGPVVLLVDAGLLACDLCKHNKLKADFRRCFGGAFTGHFILIVGRSRGKLLYRDPALRARLCAASPARLQRARAAPTDHDVILVYRNYRDYKGS